MSGRSFVLTDGSTFKPPENVSGPARSPKVFKGKCKIDETTVANGKATRGEGTAVVNLGTIVTISAVANATSTVESRGIPLSPAKIPIWAFAMTRPRPFMKPKRLG
mmetsp:Transcript_37685/g.58626  ORF Transcript_37685/g.58626 Transcript_37685/m.58626 type:complete len:106 (-) Transcript_37685:666-983(-)